MEICGARGNRRRGYHQTRNPLSHSAMFPILIYCCYGFVMYEHMYDAFTHINPQQASATSLPATHSHADLIWLGNKTCARRYQFRSILLSTMSKERRTSEAKGRKSEWLTRRRDEGEVLAQNVRSLARFSSRLFHLIERMLRAGQERFGVVGSEQRRLHSTYIQLIDVDHLHNTLQTLL